MSELSKEDLDIILSSNLATIQVGVNRIVESIPIIIESVKDVSMSISKLLEEIKKPKIKEIVEEEAMIDERIRDTNVHMSRIVELNNFDVVVIFIKNELDQDITVQVKGNIAKTYIDAFNVGDRVIVNKGESRSVAISIYRETWSPYSFCEVVANAVPTNGSVHIKYLKRVG
jgi:hypothetical protein